MNSWMLFEGQVRLFLPMELYVSQRFDENRTVYAEKMIRGGDIRVDSDVSVVRITPEAEHNLRSRTMLFSSLNFHERKFRTSRRL